MKNKWIAIAGAIAVMTLTSTVQATPIVGGISLSGTYTTDAGGDLNTASQFLTFSGVYVASVGGNYIGNVNQFATVTMNAFSWTSFPVGGVNPLWFTTTGTAASFNLDSPITVSQPGDNTLTLKGSGMLYLAGFDPTAGTWTFTANQGGGSFSFSSSNAALPDGGATLMLLGTALSAVGLLRKKFIA